LSDMRWLCLAEERIRSKAEARSHADPLREARLSEERTPSARESDWLPGPQTEEVSELVWDPKELDADLPVGWRPRIVDQALGPREPHVHPLRPRQARRFEAALARRTLRLPHLEALIPQKPLAGSPMLSPAPVLPKKRRTSDGERVEKDTDLARLCGGMAIPLALLAQRTGTTTANAGAIHHAQAAIGFSAVFMREQVLASWTLERAIGLKREVGSGETPRFPGRGRGRWTVSRDRS
jgi:hypothetical protein